VIARGIAAAAAVAMLLGAAPAARFGPPPPNAQTALVRRYVDDLAAGRYADAYALLDPAARAYFRSAPDYASTFTADGFGVASYVLAGARGDERFRLYLVREAIRLTDPARDTPANAVVTIAYGVIGTGAAGRIKDLGRPWRAFATGAAATAGGLRVRVKKVSFYDRAIAIVVTIANVGDGAITVLPYGRSVLRDDLGALYRPIVDRTWTHTDRRLFLGLRLAAGDQVTGVLSFASPRLDDRARHFTLTLAPSIRAGADAPFSLDVPGIAAPA
jgi:hypothetical protein